MACLPYWAVCPIKIPSLAQLHPILYSCNRLALRCAVTLQCLYLLVTRWSRELVMFWLLLATSPSPVRSVASAGLAQAGRDELQNAVEWLHKGGKVDDIGSIAFVSGL